MSAQIIKFPRKMKRGPKVKSGSVASVQAINVFPPRPEWDEWLHSHFYHLTYDGFRTLEEAFNDCDAMHRSAQITGESIGDQSRRRVREIVQSWREKRNEGPDAA